MLVIVSSCELECTNSEDFYAKETKLGRFVTLFLFIVFGMLLGDTLILDDLDCANKYRQEVSMALPNFFVVCTSTTINE